MTCVVRRRELSASFLVAFPGAWLAWLSLSVDGGGRAELSEGQGVAARIHDGRKS